MNLLLLDPAELDEHGRATLADRRASHVHRVLRCAPGDQVRAGVIGAGSGFAEIEQVAPDRVTVRLAPGVADDPAPATPPVDLVLAVPRPAVLGRVLQTAAALGVGHIDLVNAWRVDKSYLGAPGLAPEALRAQLVLGCEQGGSTYLPSIAVHRLLMPFVRARLDRDDDARRVVLHPRDCVPLERAAPPGGCAYTLAAVGPEGGWIDREVATFAERGFSVASLGPRVLRVDTAVAALLAQLALLARL